MKNFLDELGLTAEQAKRILTKKPNKPQVIKRHITEDEFEFAIISDTHLCSRYEAINELHTFYAICKKMGIKDVVHAGDLIDGGMSHAGWENEIHTFGVGRQVDYVVENYPKVDGITTYFISGSHDYSFWKRAGAEAGKMIAEKRSDMIYLGMILADVWLGNLKIRLIHPSGGAPYSKSYRAQKIAENIESGNKPHILVIGHLHYSVYFHYRNMHIFHAGCFQKQTPYLQEKSLNPDVGGWTVKVRTANYKKKSIVSITPSWIPFFI
jgi:predicted phosphodiesterase